MKQRQREPYSNPGIRSRILLLLQSLPSLVKLGHHGVVEVYDLKAGHICTSVLDFREVTIQETLQTEHVHNKLTTFTFPFFGESGPVGCQMLLLDWPPANP